MTTNLASFLRDFEPFKRIAPRLGKLAKNLVLGLVFLIFLSAVGAVTLTILLFRLATQPNPSKIDQVNQRLDRIEQQLNIEY